MPPTELLASSLSQPAPEAPRRPLKHADTTRDQPGTEASAVALIGRVACGGSSVRRRAFAGARSLAAVVVAVPQVCARLREVLLRGGIRAGAQGWNPFCKPASGSPPGRGSCRST
jgi:hypothetical protein